MGNRTIGVGGANGVRTRDHLSARAFQGSDFGDPADENGLLRGLGVREPDTHTHSRKNEDYLPVGFEDAVVAGDFDDHGGPVGKWIGEINVATCHAEVGDSRFEFGTGSDVNDSGFGGERIARIATPFAATGGWRFLPLGSI